MSSSDGVTIDAWIVPQEDRANLPDWGTHGSRFPLKGYRACLYFVRLEDLKNESTLTALRKINAEQKDPQVFWILYKTVVKPAVAKKPSHSEVQAILKFKHLAVVRVTPFIKNLGSYLLSSDVRSIYSLFAAASSLEEKIELKEAIDAQVNASTPEVLSRSEHTVNAQTQNTQDSHSKVFVGGVFRSEPPVTYHFIVDGEFTKYFEPKETKWSHFETTTEHDEADIVLYFIPVKGAAAFVENEIAKRISGASSQAPRKRKQSHYVVIVTMLGEVLTNMYEEEYKLAHLQSHFLVDYEERNVADFSSGFPGLDRNAIQAHRTRQISIQLTAPRCSPSELLEKQIQIDKEINALIADLNNAKL